MKDFIIADIENIEFVAPSGVTFQGMTYNRITTLQKLNTLISSGKFWTNAGNHYKANLTQRPFFYKEGALGDKEAAFRTLGKAYNGLENFMFFMWFIKDCSPNVLQALGYIAEKDLIITANNDSSFSMSDGRLSIIAFTEEEISRVSNIMHQYATVVGFPKPHNNPIEYNFQEHAIHHNSLPEYNDLNRVQRAMDFLRLARESSIPLLKITFYTLLLECLFSVNDTTEINYKVALRAASYVTQDIEEREQLFDFIRDAYNLRSKYVHGDNLAKEYNRDSLPNTSTKLDILIRNILLRIIKDDSALFLMKPDQLNKYYRTLVLRPTSSQTPPSAAA